MTIRHTASLAALVATPVLGLVLAVPTPEPVQQLPGLSGSGGLAAPTPCPNKIGFEPVVTYEVSGTTFAGPLYQHLTVYNNGHALFARKTTFTDPVVEAVQVTPADVAQLRDDLAATGAFGLCDLPPQGADIPLTTITVFSGGTDARSHTFSFFFSAGGQAAAKQVIEAFITTHVGTR